MAFKYKRRSHEEIDKRANQQGSDFVNFLKKDFPSYAARDGDNWIRILPPSWKDAEHYGLNVFVHYGIGPDNGSVLCRNKMGGEKCPICEARVKAERAGNEELAKELRISKRVVVWLLDMKDEEKGPQLWAMPWTVDRDINKISFDKHSREYYEIDNPEVGYDVNFDKTGKGITTKYIGFQIARRPTSVDEDHLDFIEDNPLPEALIERSYEEVKDIFEGGADPEEDEKPARPARRDREEAPSKRREADEAPRRARREPEEEETPRKRARAEPEEDEEEERPRSRTRSEEAPRRARRDEEEEEPRRRTREPDEEPRRARRDEPAPRSKLAKDLDDEIPFEDDEEEEDAPPKKGITRAKLNKPQEEERTPEEDRAARLRERYKQKGK